MKYVEEISAGEMFTMGNSKYFLTNDFNSSNSRLCYEIGTGNARWVKSNEAVETLELYVMDENNHIVSLKNNTEIVVPNHVKANN